MSIASEITKLNTNLTASYTACANKGAAMPVSQNFDNLATCISSIPTGGGSSTLQADTLYDITGFEGAGITKVQFLQTFGPAGNIRYEKVGTTLIIFIDID